MSQLTHAVRRGPRRVRLTVWIILLLLAAFALVWIGRASAEKGRASGPAAVSKTVTTVTSKADAIDLTDLPCTTSPNFVNMPNTGVNFKSGGNGSRSVIVLFQGSWTIENHAFIRLLIDGVVQSGPTSVGVGEREQADTHGFNFVSDPLPPGQHFAFIQWASSSGQACVEERSLIVLHK
jgi:hypothetical protein